MKRNVYNKLIEWKKAVNRKPLILNGARQVGKTWLLKEFGKNEYKNVAYVSCDKNQDIAKIFDINFDVQRIIRSLSALTGESIEPEKTLIVLDEIQTVPNAVASLKYFCEDAPEYHIAVAGSLLGISLHFNDSFPVGKVNTIRLFPMNFVEFLEAIGKEQYAEMIRNADYEGQKSLSTSFVELLRLYYYVGGMPGVVSNYVTTGDLKEVRAVQKEILNDYDNDFSKHAPEREVPRIRMVWNSVPSQLSKENKKFIYGAVRKGARASEFEMAIRWLIDAGLIYKSNRCTQPQIPLKFYEDMNVFKLFFIDCGLMGALAETPVSTMIIGNDIFKEYKGAFTEQYVMQQMKSIDTFSIYYYSADNSRMEIDFLVQQGDRVVPIEVKAEKNVRANSLHQYLESHKDIKAIRFSLLDYKEQDVLTNIPLYGVLSAIK